VSRRAGGIGLAVLGGLALTILLTVCMITSVLPALGRAVGNLQSNTPVGSNETPTAPPSRGGTATAAPTATSAPPSDWYTFSSGGILLDIPSVLGSSHGYFIDNFTGKGVDFSYQGAPAVTPLQQLAKELTVSVLYATQITNRNICPQGGTPLQVGSGSATISAWERDNLSPSETAPSVAVNFVFNGAAIEIDLLGRGPPETFLARYGAIWHHLLASIAPQPSQPQRTTRPCS
jgi:hypothetical protein